MSRAVADREPEIRGIDRGLQIPGVVGRIGCAGLSPARTVPLCGGKPFDRGHIHHILSNPIYAGRIRHKRHIFEGQHPAIIDPGMWEQVQHMLEGGAAKARGAKRKAARSPLAGKLFDETGDRLTPTHSQKNGKRLRYYISRRLVTDRSRKHPDAWRLPAEQLEGLLADLIQRYLGRPDAASSMTQNMTASEIVSVMEKLADRKRASEFLELIDRADLRPGAMTVLLGQHDLARLLYCQPDQIDPAGLNIAAPFRMRRRGVELKLHLGDASAEIDRTLVQNIVKARRWLAMIIEGRTFTEIAEAEGTSKRRVQDVVDLALLAPDVLDAIASGEQPDGLTTDYLIKSGFPAVWSEQRAQFASL